MLTIRLMTAADIPTGMALVRANGWNQTEVDWRRALDLEPTGCFVAAWDGRPVGTATACVFEHAAWIALVLVDAAHRRRGIGTELMKHTLAYLDGRGVRSVCLTATPMGQSIYEKLGFIGEYPLARYEGVTQAGPPVLSVKPVAPADLEALARLELETTGIDRRKLLARQYAEQMDDTRLVRRDGRVRGFMTTRAGLRAIYLGPCLADAEAGPLLLADAFQRHAGRRLFLDIPLENSAAIALVSARGLSQQRRLYRMWRGPVITGSLKGLWTSWGPEKG